MSKLPDTKDLDQLMPKTWPPAVHLHTAKPQLILISMLGASLGGILLLCGIYLALGGQCNRH